MTFLYTLTPGACPKSYGMNVGRLAGLPASVVGRAAQCAARMAVRCSPHPLPPPPSLPPTPPLAIVFSLMDADAFTIGRDRYACVDSASRRELSRTCSVIHGMCAILQAVELAAKAGKSGVEAALGLGSTQALLQIARCLRRPGGSQPPPAAALADLQSKLKLLMAGTD